MPALLDFQFALHGFHPTMGHCLISNNYGFTQIRSEKCSVIVYGKPPFEFDDAKSAAEWCAAEEVWFLDPHNAYQMIEVE
jgi:hypothetical protein